MTSAQLPQNPQYRSLADVAASLDVSDRWLRARVLELGVPHLSLSRRRIGFTPEHIEALHKALESTATTPTQRSRARQRKGRAA